MVSDLLSDPSESSVVKKAFFDEKLQRYRSKQPRNREAEMLRRQEFKTLIYTVDNITCGFAEEEFPRWHQEVMNAMRDNWPVFWASRGMTPPPVGRDVIYGEPDESENMRKDGRTNVHTIGLNF